MARRRREIPRFIPDFDRLWPSFKTWLVEHGSAIYAPTNAYELARFMTDVGTGIIYCNSKGMVTHWHGGADVAMRAFLVSGPWRAIDKSKRDKHFLRDYAALIKRDGATCMYCDITLTFETATIEHVVPVTSGGTNHLANKALACGPHNREAGHLSAREKLELAIRIRTARKEAAA